MARQERDRQASHAERINRRYTRKDGEQEKEKRILVVSHPAYNQSWSKKEKGDRIKKGKSLETKGRRNNLRKIV